MKVKQLTLTALSVLFISSVSIIACKKDSDKVTDSTASDIEIAQNDALAEGSYNDATTMTDQVAVQGNLNLRPSGTEGTLGSPCASAVLDTVSSPRKITIDFGTSNCVCLDGRSRRGKIIATFTGRYRDSNTVVTLSFDNYFVNDNQIKGTKTVTNKGHNAAGHLVYAVEVNGQIIKANNGGTITWTSSRQREWLTGENTLLNPADDSYAITGTASGTTAAGGSYTITIKQALICKLTCRWFESGVVEFKPQNAVARTLDFGNTGCDANATLTILGISVPVVLP